jgi:hypothetical protein
MLLHGPNKILDTQYIDVKVKKKKKKGKAILVTGREGP